jgi:hypothetical protein
MNSLLTFRVEMENGVLVPGNECGALEIAENGKIQLSTKEHCRKYNADISVVLEAVDSLIEEGRQQGQRF